MNYIFIYKAVFFPNEKVLAIGDLHLGYEQMLRELGIVIPEIQTKQVLNELNQIFLQISEKKQKVEKVIFIGDIKHFFKYEKHEKFIFFKILELLKKYVKEKNIILIRGNHDKLKSFAGKKLKNYYIYKNIAFIQKNI